MTTNSFHSPVSWTDSRQSALSGAGSALYIEWSIWNLKYCGSSFSHHFTVFLNKNRAWEECSSQHHRNIHILSVFFFPIFCFEEKLNESFLTSRPYLLTWCKPKLKKSFILTTNTADHKNQVDFFGFVWICMYVCMYVIYVPWLQSIYRLRYAV